MAQTKEVLPRGLCSMCQFGTPHFGTCPHCGVSNCRHIHTEHVRRCEEVNGTKIEVSDRALRAARAIMEAFYAKDIDRGYGQNPPRMLLTDQEMATIIDREYK